MPPNPVVNVGKERPGVKLTTHPHLVLSSGMSRNYMPSPPCRLHGCNGTALLYFYNLYNRASKVAPLEQNQAGRCMDVSFL
jgi:hypothetical protein